MTSEDDWDNGVSPADNVLSLMENYAPQAAETVRAWVPRLFHALAEGHSFVYVPAQTAADLLQAAPIVGEGDAPLILRGRRLFLGRMFHLEENLSQEIKRLSSVQPDFRQPEKWREALALLFPDSGSRDQQAAAALACVQNFTVMSGGPGTGKTTAVAKLLALLCGDDLPRIALAAPTGKAAARMSEALRRALAKIDTLPAATAAYLAQLEGQTVHRLLGLKPPQMQPEYHDQHRLPVDIVIVDEVSMLDTYLLWQLLRALPTHCRVILLGDEHQLPSVNAGAVLAALVQNAFRLPENAPITQILPKNQLNNITPPVAKLTISHRFGAGSGVGCLARAVVSGEAERAWAQFQAFPDELRAHANTPFSQIAQSLYEHHADYWQAIDNQDVACAFEHQQRLIVLTARRADAHELNAQYRLVLQKKGRAQADKLWFAGQMLIITRNDPATHLFNGDVGLVLPQGSGLAAWFADGKGGFRAVALSRLPAHEWAFAMTVHKSQGSEYDEVWLLPPQSPQKENQKENNDFSEQGFNKNLLYTAITRAKRRFVYWGDERGFQAACLHTENRRTALGWFLRET